MVLEIVYNTKAEKGSGFIHKSPTFKRKLAKLMIVNQKSINNKFKKPSG